MLVRAILVVAGFMMGPGVGHAKTPNAAGLGVAGPTSGPAVTFGQKTAIPSGYYQLCKTGNVVCRQSRGAKDTEDGVVRVDDKLLKELASVNADVNRSIRPVEDAVQFHVVDRWSVAPQKGDCEDFALTKKARLLKLGWPSSALLIALAHTATGVEHAILIARTDRGDFVLDNLRANIRPWSAGLYRWKAIQAPGDVWTWYQFGGGTIRIASTSGRGASKPLPVVSMAEPDKQNFAEGEGSAVLDGKMAAGRVVPIVRRAMSLVAASDVRTGEAANRSAIAPVLEVSAQLPRRAQLSPWFEPLLLGERMDDVWGLAASHGDRCSKEAFADVIAPGPLWHDSWTKSSDALAWAVYELTVSI